MFLMKLICNPRDMLVKLMRLTKGDKTPQSPIQFRSNLNDNLNRLYSLDNGDKSDSAVIN